VLRVDHPDILEFIAAKDEDGKLENFNLSVAVTEEFMECVKADCDFDLKHPRTWETVKTVRARDVYRKIVEYAHKNGEPGILFIDKMNEDNPTPELGKIEATNPCGEQPLLPYEACNLGSINLAKMTANGSIDYGKLAEVIEIAVKFLDNVIDTNDYPLERIREQTLKTRKIGLGVMGWADALIDMGVPYDSETAVELAKHVMKFIKEKAHDVSIKLVKSRGPYPAWEEEGNEVRLYARRNATLTTIAPTGSISMIAGCSSGIEPLFAWKYQRRAVDKVFDEVHPVVEKKLKELGYGVDVERLPEELTETVRLAHDVSPEWHVRMQSAFQQYVDNGVSKTVNLPSNATIDDVAEIFMFAHEMVCKGVTVYRDGSREGQVLSTEKDKKKEGDTSVPLKRKRPRITTGITMKELIGCGKLYVTVNSDEEGMCEVFTANGRGGGCPSQSEATSRLISLALRAGVEIDDIIKQLRGIRCPAAIKREGVKNTSCPDAIGRSLEEYLNYGMEYQLDKTRVKRNGEEKTGSFVNGCLACPDCGMELEHDGGCVSCRNCGYSKCE